MSSYLHPENAKRVQQIQDLVCLESEREAVNLIIALAWQDVLAHLVNKVGCVPAVPALPQLTDSGNASNGPYSSAHVNSETYTSPDQAYLDPGYLPPNTVNSTHVNGHSNSSHHHSHHHSHHNGHTSGYTNGHQSSHSNSYGSNDYINGITGHTKSNGYTNGRETQLFTTLRDVQF